MELEKAFRELANEVKEIIQQRIQTYGINPRVGRNTLEGSELEKSIKVTPLENGVALQIADYWEFVSRGWKRTGNYPGTFRMFLANIDEWVRRKGIIPQDGMTQNQLVWAIVKSIWMNGLRPRPFMVYDDDGDLTKMLPELEEYIDRWFDAVFDEITDEIDKRFNQ